MKPVGIVGSTGDPHAGYVAAAIARRGGEPVFLDPALIPERAAVSLEDGALAFDGRRLDEVRAFYLKAVPLSLPPVDPAALPHRAFPRWQDQLAAERERQSFVGSILRQLRLRGATLVNP